jgi:hypothetical protein
MYRPRSQVVYASSVQFIHQLLGGGECALVYAGCVKSLTRDHLSRRLLQIWTGDRQGGVQNQVKVQRKYIGVTIITC